MKLQERIKISTLNLIQTSTNAKNGVLQVPNPLLQSKNIKFVRKNITYKIVEKQQGLLDCISCYIPADKRKSTTALIQHIYWIV